MRNSLILLTLGGFLLAAAIGSWSRPEAKLPGLAISAPPGPVGMDRCRNCHPGVCDSFQSAPHLHTLSSTDDPAILEHFAGRTFHAGEIDYAVARRDGKLWLESSAWLEPIRIDWVFGSGQHAQTPVSTRLNPAGQTESLELSISWYPDINGLGPTLGTSEMTVADIGAGGAGSLLDHADTLDCFGCHTTFLPLDNGRIAQGRIVAGVRCERCHTNSHAHATAMEAGDYERGAAAMETWSDLTPLESILRCGECHRRPDQLPPEDLSPDNKMLLRFAPVGLSQSPCFVKQETVRGTDGKPLRLDCTTCHNPHQPARTNPDFYRQECLKCHGTHPSQAALCAAEPMTSECLKCHMPQLKVQEHLFFTDHWIRVRDE